jgi:hypothetical protein
MTTHLHARPNDEAPAVGAAQGFEKQEQSERIDFRATGAADQAAMTIAGEHCARSYLDQLRDGTAQPGDLAAMLCYLRGELLHGACRRIEKAMEGRRNA